MTSQTHDKPWAEMTAHTLLDIHKMRRKSNRPYQQTNQPFQKSNRPSVQICVVFAPLSNRPSVHICVVFAPRDRADRTHGMYLLSDPKTQTASPLVHLHRHTHHQHHIRWDLYLDTYVQLGITDTDTAATFPSRDLPRCVCILDQMSLISW